jgi:hypothetical protein
MKIPRTHRLTRLEIKLLHAIQALTRKERTFVVVDEKVEQHADDGGNREGK